MASYEEFVELINNEAIDIPCDSCGVDQILLDVPLWFNEKLFIRGRKYIVENLTAQMTSSLNGLICVLSIPNSLRILIMTQKSSTTLSAYKRYLSTILHLHSWLRSDLRPGTNAWKSLLAIRKRHLQASKKACLNGEGKITQTDLVITLFGFFGYGFLKPLMLGFHIDNDEDIQAYLHFWRTIGFMVGIHDKFNFCEGTVEDVREKATYICEKFCKPNITHPPEYFFHMVTAMLSGMFYVTPCIQIRPFLFYAYRLNDIPGFGIRKTEVKLSNFELNSSNDDKTYLMKRFSSQKPNNNCYEFLSDKKQNSEENKAVGQDCVLDGSLLFESMSTLDHFFLFGMGYVFGKALYNPIARWFINAYFYIIFIVLPYLPLGALLKFKTSKVYVNMFKEDSSISATLKTNREVLDSLYGDKIIEY